jgi:hypothetical protein
MGKSLIKRFDVHLKTVDGIGQQTLCGAFITIIAIVIVCLLAVSELRVLAKKDVESYVLPDISVGIDEVRITFDVEFPSIPCTRLNFVHEVIRGGVQHALIDEEIRKIPSALGCRLVGSKSTEKVAGTFQFRIEDNQLARKHDMMDFDDGTPLRAEIISHHIHKLMFISDDSISDDYEYPKDSLLNAKKLVDGHYPLNGHKFAEERSSAIKHYGVSVVPTVYKYLNGSLARMNQYSVTQRNIDPMKSAMGIVLGGQVLQGFYGVFFSYDFYPVL